ncbi:MAG: TraR/DksA C4-type zinc finger protein [Pseudomonadota bacterium]
MKIKIGSHYGGWTAISGETSDSIRLPGSVHEPQHSHSEHEKARLLAAIEKAISRLDSGTYGVCESCGCDIRVKRLMAYPLTTLCDLCDD